MQTWLSYRVTEPKILCAAHKEMAIIRKQLPDKQGVAVDVHNLVIIISN